MTNGRSLLLRSVRPPVWFAALAVAVGEVVVATRDATFFQDDFIHLGQARAWTTGNGIDLPARLTWDYLSAGLFEHFSPMARLCFWIAAATDDPIRTSRLLVVATVVIAVAGIGELCRALLNRTVAGLAVAVIAAQGLVVAGVAAWPVAAFQILTAVGFSCAAIASGTRFLTDHTRWRHGAAAVIWYVLAVAGIETAVVVPVVLAAWFILCATPDLTREQRRERLRATSWFWLTIAVVAMVSMANFRLHYYDAQLQRGTISSTASMLWHAIAQGALPAMLGIRSPDSSGIGVAAIVGLLVWMALGVAVVGAGGRRAAAGVAIAVGGLVVTYVGVCYARSGVFGVALAPELRYAAFPLMCVVVGLCQSTGAVLARGGRRTLWTGATLAVAVVATAVLLPLNSSSVVRVQGLGPSAREYTGTFLAAVDARSTPPHVISMPVPDDVAWSWFTPYNWASRSLGELTDKVVWNTPGEHSTYRVGSNGSLVAVDLVAIESYLDPGPCTFVTTADAEIAIDLPEPVDGERIAVRLRGSVDRQTNAAVAFFVDWIGTEPVNGDIVGWKPGAFDTVLAIAGTTARDLRITGLALGTEVCVDRVDVIRLDDATGRQS